MKYYIYDIETNPNYFLLAIKDLSEPKEKPLCYELFNDQTFSTDTLTKIRLLFETPTNCFIGFNSNNFDLPIMKVIFDKKNLTPKDIKFYTKIIINKGWSGFEFEKEFISDPYIRRLQNKGWNRPAQQLDLFGLVKSEEGTASGLKIVAGRIHSEKLEEMPYAHDKILTRSEADEIKAYCINDLNMTADLYESLKPTIKIREDLAERYNIKTDIRSKGDATVAEIVIKERIKNEYGVKVFQDDVIKNLPPIYDYNEYVPTWLNFKTKLLQDVLDSYKVKILIDNQFKYDFQFDVEDIIYNKPGIYPIPTECKKTKTDRYSSIGITIGETDYVLGTGGIHSTENSRIIKCADDEMLQDIDVASYYPACILNNDYVPEHYNHDEGNYFKDVFEDIVNQRLEDKKKGKGADLKIVINGTYGKYKSNMPRKSKGKYTGKRSLSALYAPHHQLNVCLTGQLALLMIIEEFELNNIKVVSANTDGLIIHTKKANAEKVKEIIKNWEDKTQFVLEPNDYKMLVNTSVNSYFAVTVDNKIKRKGVDFLEQGDDSNKYSKEPKFEIVKTALIEYFMNETPIEDTIINCKDITQFLKVGKITRTAKKIKEEGVFKIKLDDETINKKVKELREIGIKTTKKANTYEEQNLYNPLNLNLVTDACVLAYNVEQNAYEFTRNLLYRFYYTTAHNKPLVKSYNGDSVSDSQGARSVLDLPLNFPNDINYQKYIDKANAIIETFSEESIKETAKQIKEDKIKIYNKVKEKAYEIPEKLVYKEITEKDKRFADDEIPF